jgi:hypothetical protein
MVCWLTLQIPAASPVVSKSFIFSIPLYQPNPFGRELPKLPFCPNLTIGRLPCQELKKIKKAFVPVLSADILSLLESHIGFSSLDGTRWAEFCVFAQRMPI